MKVWEQDKFIDAWNFVSKIHNSQRLPGSEIPYINHLGLVAMEAMAVVTNSDIDDPNLLVLCALLHDSIEDTPTKAEEIAEQFGEEVAEGVLALTKNTRLPTKREQMSDSIERIKKQPKEIWMVKLCDRITNLQPPPKHWDKNKIAGYQSEAKFILEQLGSASQFLSNRLNDKISNYSQYL